jgi:hypothetical protein
MKKIAYKKSLQLNKEVVRALVSSDLREVDGGNKPMTRSMCAGDCIAVSGHACQI